MSAIKWTALAALAFLIQTHFSLFRVPLNLTLLVVYAFALRHLSSRSAGPQSVAGELKSTAFGVAVGFFEDILAGSIVGPHIFSKGMTGFVTTFSFNDIIFRWTPLVGVCALLSLNFLDSLTGMGLRVLFTHLSVGWSSMLQSFAVQALITLPFGVLLRPPDPD